MYHKSEFGQKSGLKQHCLMRGVIIRKVRAKQRGMYVCVHKLIHVQAHICKVLNKSAYEKVNYQELGTTVAIINSMPLIFEEGKLMKKNATLRESRHLQKPTITQKGPQSGRYSGSLPYFKVCSLFFHNKNLVYLLFSSLTVD